tara:strand:- start:73 stop:702 length:630 start_codon:yes stop_codon:yes gene_type:complete
MNKIIKLHYDFKVIGNPDKAIVAIHGWGGDSSSMRPLVDLMKIENCKWFFPEATYDKDGSGKSWTYQKDDGTYERDQPIKMMQNFINQEVLCSFKPIDIYIIGFSQGALICYESILNMDVEFGGIFPICGFITEIENKRSNYPNKALKNTPIIIGHGREDNVVSPQSSKDAYNVINDANFNVELMLYRGGHKIGIEYLRKAKSVINKKK